MSLVVHQARRWQRIGSVPVAIHLGAADVGQAELADGQIVAITWGRNLTGEQAVELAQQLIAAGVQVQFVQLGSDRLELVIPGFVAGLLNCVLVHRWDVWPGATSDAADCPGCEAFERAACSDCEPPEQRIHIEILTDDEADDDDPYGERAERYGPWDDDDDEGP